MSSMNGMNDVQALISALARACMEREKAETIAQNLLAENRRLAAQIAELEKPPVPEKAPSAPEEKVS